MEGLKKSVKILFVILILVIMVIIGGVSAVYYENWEKDAHESDSEVAQFLAGTKTGANAEKELRPNFTCLFLGRNQLLTDFIMVAQYNPNTRQVSLLSIPRDTNVGNATIDGKLNSIYAYSGRNAEKVVAKVKELTGVDIQHYVVFDAKILRKVVDEIGGVTVDVPINMNYDDPYQDLYIHLKKGVQKLTGAQAEQFVRFRSGYANADLGRIDTQHQFIKALISEVLKPANIGKINNLIKIVIEGTSTDITTEVIEEYLGDVVTFKSDRVRIETAPGYAKNAVAPNGWELSFFWLDKGKTKALVDDLFYGKGSVVEETEEELLNDDASQEVTSSKISTTAEEEKELVSEEKLRVEVLNANAKSGKMNELVEKLNKNGCNVVKIGNYATTKVETSRIIVYGTVKETDLEKVKELSGIQTIEENNEKSEVEFTIIIGENY